MVCTNAHWALSEGVKEKYGGFNWFKNDKKFYKSIFYNYDSENFTKLNTIRKLLLHDL